MATSPISEKVLFPKSRDSFPTVYDAGTSTVPQRYTKLWAEYYNKIRNFVGVLEPLLYPTTAGTYDASIKSLSAIYTLNPAPTFNDIIIGFSKELYIQGRTPPTHVFPFEIVITSSKDSYKAWPTTVSDRDHSGGPTPLLFQTTQSILNSIIGGQSFFSNKPMVSVALISKKAGNTTFVGVSDTTKYAINHYCVAGNDTILVRGSIINLDADGVYTDQYPPFDTADSDIDKIFDKTSLLSLAVSFTGVRV